MKQKTSNVPRQPLRPDQADQASQMEPLLPVFEAVMNAFQAIQERRGPGTIIVNVVPAHSLGLDDVERIERVIVTDDGVGFTDENMDSFNTAFSEYKYSRGSKGVGRFLWLKAFDQVEVDSVFDAGGQEGLLRRRFTFDTTYDPDLVVAAPASDAKMGTSVELLGFQEPFRSDVPLDLPLIAQRMCEHFILLHAAGLSGDRAAVWPGEGLAEPVLRGGFHPIGQPVGSPHP